MGIGDFGLAEKESVRENIGSNVERCSPYRLDRRKDMPELIQLIAFSLLGIGAGVSFVTQQALNADLRGCLGSASWAAFISYSGGVLTMAAVLLATREPWLSASSVAKSSWWLWCGGFFGAIYIVVAIVLLPRLGAATVVALIVSGQMLASLVFDRFGFLGLERHPISLPSLAGAALLIAGVVLIQL
jgi:transporter family-2 protein